MVNNVNSKTDLWLYLIIIIAAAFFAHVFHFEHSKTVKLVTESVTSYDMGVWIYTLKWKAVKFKQWRDCEIYSGKQTNITAFKIFA